MTFKRYKRPTDLLFLLSKSQFLFFCHLFGFFRLILDTPVLLCGTLLCIMISLLVDDIEHAHSYHNYDSQSELEDHPTPHPAFLDGTHRYLKFFQ